MGRKPKSKRDLKTSGARIAYAVRTSPNWPLLALSCIGILLTGYLAWTSFSGGSVKGCDAGGGCQVVLTSRWAILFGLPTAFWGFMAYAGLAGIAFIRRVDRHWSYAWTAAFFGVCYSVYLTTISLTVLKSACPYCLTSLALMSAILVLVSLQRPATLANRSWFRLTAGRGALAATAILLLHLNYTTPVAEEHFGPEDPEVRALAEHLTKQGARFYGASWCPHCQEQKRLFGASVPRLPYVECSPGGRGSPASPLCANVRTYPTWVINGRSFAQVMSLKELAAFSGYKPATEFK